MFVEFLVLPSTSTNINQSESTCWSRNSTLLLIDAYKQLRNKVGTLEVKNMKRLWEIIAEFINKEIGVNFTHAHVENRWRVIERNYKKTVDNNNKTGRARKFFEYEKEMDEIFAKKHNVNPELLLSTETVEHECKENQGETISTMTEEITKKRKRIDSKKKITRCDILEEMRKDKKTYYDHILVIQKEKLEIEKQKLKEKQTKNELLQKGIEVFTECVNVLRSNNISMQE